VTISMRAWLRNLGKGLLVLIAAGVAAEGFLRLVVEPESMLRLGFTPGVQVPDDAFGFAFKGGYQGYMRDRDGVFGVPLALDANGFRLANANRRPGPRSSVVLIGGRSMMFCFGLLDRESVSGQLAAQSGHALEVQNAAWVGVDLYRMWHLFRQRLEGDRSWRVAVIGVYRETPEGFMDVPADFRRPPKPVPAEVFFRWKDGNVIWPMGVPLQTLLGRYYYRSFVGYGVLSFVDEVLGKLGVRLVQGSEEPEGAGEIAADPKALGLERYRGFLRHMDRELARHGTKMLVAFLPGVNLPPGYYDELAAAVPEGIPWLDLEKELGGRLSDYRSISNGHYGPEQARLIGGRLSQEVDRLLEGGMAAPRPAAPPEGAERGVR